MMKYFCIPFLCFSAFLANAEMKGFTKEACDITEAALQKRMLEEAGTTSTLCGKDLTPTQTGGFSCRTIQAKGCKKSKIRCITQFACVAGAAQESVSPPVESDIKSHWTEKRFVQGKDGKETVIVKKGVDTGKMTSTTTIHSDKSVTNTVKTDTAGMKGTISITQDAETVKEQQKIMNATNEAIAECKPFETSSKHPIIPSETIRFQVHGEVDGICKFTESLPNNGLITCLFTKTNREEIKKDSHAIEKLLANDPPCKITGYE